MCLEYPYTRHLILILHFQCIANAKPLYEVELIWFKDGRPIDEAGIAFSFNDLWNRTLSLINADFAHEGRYKCQVRMKTGGPRLTKEAKVTVLGNLIFICKMYLTTFRAMVENLAREFVFTTYFVFKQKNHISKRQCK